METTKVPCSSSSEDIQLPPGFRFHPSDEELIVHYLKNKVNSNLLPASVIADIDLYKYNPWELPKRALFGEEEWYFFTPRDRKYPNGARPNRAAASGYWKATGTDKPILNSSGTTTIGVKKALVFYKGRPPKGLKTEWIMHEYRLLDSMIMWNPKRKGCMRLDDWVLCRVRQKSNTSRNPWEDRNGPSSYEPAASYFLKPNDLLQASVGPNMEMIKSYLCNDCPMLPFLFASSPDFSSKETATTTISFQSSTTDQRTCSKDSCEEDKNLQFSVTSLDNLLFNPLKRKIPGKTDEENWVLAGRTLSKKKEVISVSEDGTTPTTDLNFCGENSDEGSNFSPVVGPWSSLIEYQEFDHLTFE